MTSSVWAVGTNNVVYFVDGRNLTRVPHKMAHVSAGEAGVWGVANNGRAYFRKGVSSSNPVGTNWVQVSGRRFKQVDSGPFGVVYGVSKNGDVRCRKKITSDKLEGMHYIMHNWSSRYHSVIPQTGYSRLSRDSCRPMRCNKHEL